VVNKTEAAQNFVLGCRFLMLHRAHTAGRLSSGNFHSLPLRFEGRKLSQGDQGRCNFMENLNRCPADKRLA
jgi:hypothetical protein